MFKYRISIATLIATGAVLFAQQSWAQTYDLVILNGRVMDPETMFDAVRNVGVRDGIIETITRDAITGSEAIDATGHVVAPGFIDTHFHALDGLSIQLAMRDGVTTGMDLEWGAMNIAEWYTSKEGQWPSNFGTAVSHEGARMVVHDGLEMSEPVDAASVAGFRAKAGEDGTIGWSSTRSDLDAMNAITRILDKGLQDGALGIGSTVGYMRTGVTTYEMFEVQRAAARYGRLTAFHSRFHPSNQTPTESPLGFDEAFTNAFLLGAPMLYQHDNDYGWWEIEEKLQMARKRGLNMWSEHYPYTAGSTTIGAEFIRPESWEMGMGYKYEETVYDPSQDKFLTKEEYQQIAQDDAGRTVILFIPPRKEWLPYWIQMPHMTVGADSMWSGLSWDDEYTDYAGHPRTAGAHAKTLRLGRELDVPLMFSLSQLSYWSAYHLGEAGLEDMKIRGRMQEGMVADITIFHPETVTDNATYKAGEQGLPSTGIPFVIVNGQIVVKEDEFQKGVWAGQPIRYDPEDTPRHVAASTEQWLRLHTLDTGGVLPEIDASDGEDEARGPAPERAKPEMQAGLGSGATLPEGGAEWFGVRDAQMDLSDLILCPIHQVPEPVAVVQREWAERLTARLRVSQ